jgi:hypothetical protein
MRQYLHLALVSLMCALLGCAADDGTDRPDDLIPADKMADILTDIHLTEARLTRFNLRADSMVLMFNRLNAQVMKKYEVDTSAYRQSYVYYSSHPDQFEKIYKDVNEKLKKIANPTSTSARSGSAMPGPSQRPAFTIPKSATQP